MSEAQQLYQLQSLDLEIEEIKRMIVSVEEQLGETDELTEARQSLADVQTTLHQQQTELRDLEWDLDSMTSKLRELESKLYGGVIKNPKELGSHEKEIQLLKDKKGQTEDRVLELMEAVETSHLSVKTAQAHLAEVQTAWEHNQSELEEERSRLRARVEQLNQARQAIAGALLPETVEIYDDLRQNKRGRAVARVEQNTCQGCHITLPSVEVQSARSSPRLVFCSSCGRILLASR